MKKAVGAITLLFLAGFLVIPASAAELRVTGLIDNIFPRVEANNSSGDQDMTRNQDTATFGRNRLRAFFNFIASDDLRGVFAIEIDDIYGAPARNRIGARCALTPASGSGAVPTSNVFNNESCGFRNAIDTNNFELKNLFADFRVPQLPIGNRWRLGGISADVTPLHPHLLYTMDAGGGDVTFTFTDQVSLLLTYIQLEEDLDRFGGVMPSTKIGEDYLTGANLQLKPIPGLDFHLIGIYGHGQAPFGPGLTGGGGPFNNVVQDFRNVTTEDRWYMGFDSRYRLGNTTIEPSFIYLLGTRFFCTPGSVINSTGTPTPCTSSAATGGKDIDYRAFEGQLVLTHTLGPWLLRAKFAYTSGNSADDDINNTGIGKKSNVKGFRPLGIDGFHRFGEWFEILGRSEVDATGGAIGPVSGGEQGTFDRFGWMVAGGNVEYQATDSLVLTGSAGAFWTAKKPGCPAVLRVGSLSGPCTGSGSPVTSSGDPALNFTGDSKYVGTEVDVGLRYTIMPGLTFTPLFGWAFLGDAYNVNNRQAQDAWALINRVIYTF